MKLYKTAHSIIIEADQACFQLSNIKRGFIFFSLFAVCLLY